MPLSLKILKATRQKEFKKKIFGFDVETYSVKNHFYCASIYGDEYQKTYMDKDEMIEDLKKNRIFRDSWICATNLGFDFFELFSGKEELKKAKFVWRGSDLICAKMRINNGQNVTFIDTMNYAKMSVEKLGNIIDVKKLKKPACLGKRPKTKEEYDELIRYNMRDSEVSQKFIRFLYDAFYGLGATPKMTIASTAMSLYKNRYLIDDYFVHPDDILIEQFKGYYGGRVEAFKRGHIEDCIYYDFNSLYPSVMRNEYPDPNSLRRCRENDIVKIESYEGMSDVEVSAPDIKIPLLPFRDEVNHKLIFPAGNFRSWQTHAELREAVKLGYTIKKVYKTYYYKKECRPFASYVEDMYKLRQRYKKEGNNMELVVKLLMNSLYGKFGQKFMGKDDWQPIPETLEELNKYANFERIGDYIRIKKDYQPPSCFCFPIWAIYTTSYGRLKLYDTLSYTDPFYCDTDSIITQKRLPDSSELGKLKVELYIKDGIIVKPKFYCLNGIEEDYVKAKGVGVKMSSEMFKRFMTDPSITYKKFMRFKESTRRGFKVNEIVDMTKNMSLEDNKRIWQRPFDHKELQYSIPQFLTDGISTGGYKYLNKDENFPFIWQEMTS